MRIVRTVKTPRVALTLLVLAAGAASPAFAQGRPDPAKLIAAQKEAMAAFSAMDGVWRGPAWTILPSGEKHNITQTERIGPFLDGSVKVIEGRGYDADGKVTFNAFGTISYNPATKAYTLHSHAMGNVGDFAIKPTADGYTWEIPMGPTTDSSLHGRHQGRHAEGSRRRPRARQGRVPELRDGPQAGGRHDLAGGRSRSRRSERRRERASGPGRPLDPSGRTAGARGAYGAAIVFRMLTTILGRRPGFFSMEARTSPIVVAPSSSAHFETSSALGLR